MTDRVIRRRYRLCRRLGRGSSGQVYEAVDTSVHDRRVAVKEIIAHGKDVPRRALREGRLLSSLRHPGIPHLYDEFSESGNWYLVMELVEGESLEDRLHWRRPSVQEAVHWLHGVADILEYLHSRQPSVVYRDVKPANVIAHEHGRVSLVDFGIAWTWNLAPAGTQGLGTPGYAAPEQYARGVGDVRMDVYGLGALAWRLLAGETPVDAPWRSFSAQPLPSLSSLNPQVTPELETLVGSMLAVLPGQRPACAGDVRLALERLGGRPSVTPAERQRVVSATPGSGSVLVADDDESLLRMLSTVLEGNGYQVTVARRGDEAGEMARAGAPDLVILDVRMPGLSGVEACRAIHETVTTRILMLTAQTSRSDAVACLESGADDYVAKPFDLLELQARVRALLRRG